MESEGLKRGGGRIPNKGTKSLIRQKKKGVGSRAQIGNLALQRKGRDTFSQTQKRKKTGW